MIHHMLRASLPVAVALVVAIGVPRDARAGQPTDQLKSHVDRIVQMLQDPALKSEGRSAERRDAVRKVAMDIFDFEETSKRALGPHWRERTPAEREEFVRLFTDLLEHSYLSKIESYQGEKISYLGETVQDDTATVKTRIVTPKRTEIPVDYRMGRKDNRWLVYDVIIEGISLVGNYRTQFNKVIQTQSYQALVEKLRAKAFTAPEAGQRRT
ncbi:MAG: organic solvent tolerance ABC transporter substrate-binding protein [Candidatus Rokuibacteriota bacterium]|nr:MAG: organic solvent tolerance ABC transporter substrate-binding protein [Candidatus Rokubacteria bacterium]